MRLGDAGEEGGPEPEAALREVEEETGVRIRLGVPLTRQRYLVGGLTAGGVKG